MENDCISRQAAIDAAKAAMSCAEYITRDDYRTVIEWIEDVPSAQPESSEIKWDLSDCISRNAAIDALCDNCDTVDAVCAHYPCKRYISIENLPSVQTEKMQLSKEDATKGTTFDCISREDAIDVLAYFDEKDPLGHTPQQIIMALPSVHPENMCVNLDIQKIATHKSDFSDLDELSSAQPEITDKQAIEHLQSTGWMQNHDKQMYEMGLKEQLADDSGSYDSLIPSAQPERIKGRWVKMSDADGTYYCCSECGNELFRITN